jgi:hypothetical protein
MALLALEKPPVSAIFDPAVPAEVEAFRPGNLDEAVGRMSRRAALATDQIAKLAEDAKSESVRLAALRSMLSDIPRAGVRLLVRRPAAAPPGF